MALNDPFLAQHYLDAAAYLFAQGRVDEARALRHLAGSFTDEALAAQAAQLRERIDTAERANDLTTANRDKSALLQLLQRAKNHR